MNFGVVSEKCSGNNLRGVHLMNNFWMEYYSAPFRQHLRPNLFTQLPSHSDFRWARQLMDDEAQLDLRIDHGDIVDNYSAEYWRELSD